MSFSVSMTFNFDPETPTGGSMTEIPLIGDWTADGPNAPESATENGELVYLFSPTLAQQMSLFMKVPQSFQTQKQISMRLSYYSPSTSGNVLLKANAYLIRKNIDSLDSTTLLRTTTNAAQGNPSTANLHQEATLDLTTASGTIGSTTILPGDLIRLDLIRDASDTDSGIVRVIPSSTEVYYQ